MIVDFYRGWAQNELLGIISYTSGGRRYVAKPVELVFEETAVNEEAEPTFHIGALYGSEFLKALMQGLIEYGIKVPENLELKGKLEAQAGHIKFLEELVKEHWGR